MSLLKIQGGRVVDPAHGRDEVADIWVDRGLIIAIPTDPNIKPDRIIDASGDVVMAAGVDVHCHVVGSKVSAGRALRPEEARRGGGFARSADPRSRSGTRGTIPSTYSTGAQYAGLGYATALDAAIAPLGARQAHLEFQDTPILDKAFLILLGNNHYVMERLRNGESDPERLSAYVAWILATTGALGVKVVNPGGVETWKQGGSRIAALDDIVPGFATTPRQILVGLAETVERLGVPHPLHLHGLNLGLPGNAETTLETMRALDGRRAHFAHIQFHSYGGDPGDSASLRSDVPRLVEYFQAHPNLSLDVGQVMFGEATAMTADGAVGQFLHELTGRKWFSHDVELETGCGIVPITYENKSFVHALQWAIGLEWYLSVDDLWRVALSTDHPNGAAFMAYPHVIALLMDKGLRDEMLAAAPALVRERCGLADHCREFSLSEIAIITRAAPARLMGLPNKGHLGPGADGDLTIYRPDADIRRMFSMPRYLIKAGEVVLDDGDLRSWPQGTTWRATPARNLDAERSIETWFNAHSTIRFDNFGIDAAEFAGWKGVKS